VRAHVRCYLRAAFELDDTCKASAKRSVPAASSRRRRPPGAQSAREPSALARRALCTVSHDERVRVRLQDHSEHVGCIVRWAPAGEPAELELDTGATIALADVKVIATAEPPRRRNSTDRRLAACAHQLGYRGHCLTKSRCYSTTFTALRQAREQHVHEQLLARSVDPAQRALAGASERVTSFRFVGQGHVTAADAVLAASAAARAREERRAAWEARALDVQSGRSG
jgi:hypothetical protein